MVLLGLHPKTGEGELVPEQIGNEKLEIEDFGGLDQNGTEVFGKISGKKKQTSRKNWQTA